MKKKTLLVLTLLLSLVFAVFPLQAATLDLWNDFPDHQGDNNFHAYAYQYSTNNYRPLAEYTGSTYAFISRDASLWYIPFITRDVISVSTDPNLAQPWISMHPSEWTWVVGHDSDHSPPAEHAVFAWQSPGEVMANISGAFKKLTYPSGSPNGVDVYIKVNNGSNLFSQTLGSGVEGSFDLSNITLHTGDFLYFGVSGRGNDQWDETWLRGTINYQPVPVPGTLLLLGSGLLALPFCRGKFRKK